jgi:hypothetical protein
MTRKGLAAVDNPRNHFGGKDPAIPSSYQGQIGRRLAEVRRQWPISFRARSMARGAVGAEQRGADESSLERLTRALISTHCAHGCCDEEHPARNNETSCKALHIGPLRQVAQARLVPATSRPLPVFTRRKVVGGRRTDDFSALWGISRIERALIFLKPHLRDAVTWTRRVPSLIGIFAIPDNIGV